jgi:Ribonuclease G/E
MVNDQPVFTKGSEKVLEQLEEYSKEIHGEGHSLTLSSLIESHRELKALADTRALNEAVQRALKSIEKLKQYAQSQHCFEGEEDFEYSSPDYSRDQVFNAGTEYGEITLARTLLKSLSIDFECPTNTKD